MLYSKYFLLNNSREANRFPENVIEALSCLTRGVPVHSDNDRWVHKNKTGFKRYLGGVYGKATAAVPPFGLLR